MKSRNESHRMFLKACLSMDLQGTSRDDCPLISIGQFMPSHRKLMVSSIGSGVLSCTGSRWSTLNTSTTNDHSIPKGGRGEKEEKDSFAWSPSFSQSVCITMPPLRFASPSLLCVSIGGTEPAQCTHVTPAKSERGSSLGAAAAGSGGAATNEGSKVFICAQEALGERRKEGQSM